MLQAMVAGDGDAAKKHAANYSHLCERYLWQNVDRVMPKV